MVRDIDKAVEFFSKKLGINVKKLEKRIAEREGVQCYVCLDTHLEIISPILPLPEHAPFPMKKRVELLKEKEMFIFGLVFKVDDPAQAASELKAQGFDMRHVYKESHDYISGLPSE